jgi:aminoglycoside phosphotransferase (APT) family kinase protein
LTEEEVQKVQAIGPRLKAVCEEMDALGIPRTLVHGDFHGGNIAMQGSTSIFFDWSDASVGHPFIDLISLLEDGDVLPDADLRGRIEQAYLTAWAGDFAPDVLQRALALAAPLAMLNMAVSYRHIFHHQEEAAHIEIPGAEVYWLKKLLEME